MILIWILRNTKVVCITFLVLVSSFDSATATNVNPMFEASKKMGLAYECSYYAVQADDTESAIKLFTIGYQYSRQLLQLTRPSIESPSYDILDSIPQYRDEKFSLGREYQSSVISAIEKIATKSASMGIKMSVKNNQAAAALFKSEECSVLLN